MEENWQKYGFPDPTLYPPYLPYVGLIKALNERRTIAGFNPVPVPDYFDLFDVQNGRIWDMLRYTIDDRIKDLKSYYIKPDKYDSLDEHSSTSDMFWTWNELLEAAADREEIIFTETSDWTRLTPRLPAEWAIQRYRMINLLKYRPILATGDVVYGWTPTIASSKEKAYNDAINNTIQHNFVSPSARIQCRGYGTTGYALSFELCKRCSAVLPAGITHAADAYLIGYAQNEYNSEFFDNLGSNIHHGWNRFKADSNGVFINLPIIPYPVQWNTRDDYSGSWVLCYNGLSVSLYSRGYLAFADFNDTFTFKEVTE